MLTAPWCLELTDLNTWLQFLDQNENAPQLSKRVADAIGPGLAFDWRSSYEEAKRRSRQLQMLERIRSKMDELTTELDLVADEIASLLGTRHTRAVLNIL